MNYRTALLVICTSAIVTQAFSQAGVPSTPPANVPLRPVLPENPAQPAPPTFEITAKWNDRGSNVLTVPLKNEDDRPLKVLGVQASRGIFVGDFPNTIGPKKEDVISFVYDAAENTDGDRDLIRVLTDRGIREIHLKIVREEAARLDTRELRWVVGSAVEPKTATLNVLPGTAVPRKLRVTGGNTATLEKVSDAEWKIRVTPTSTAKSGQFAVFVEFDKGLPGKAVVILGVIQPRE